MKDRSKLIFMVCAVIIGIGLIYSASYSLLQYAVYKNAYGANDSARLEDTIELRAFENIHVNVSDANIELVDSGVNGPYKLELVYFNARKIAYQEKDGALEVWSEPDSSKRLHFGWFGNQYYYQTITGSVKIYCPTGTVFQDVALSNEDGKMVVAPIKASTVTLNADYGSLAAQGITADKADISLGSGPADLKEIYAGELTVLNDYGDVILENTKADFLSSSVTIDMDSGKLKVKNINTEQFYAKNDYGNVDLQSLAADTASVELDSGNLNMDTVTGAFSISNDYGAVKGKNLVFSALDVKADSGNVMLSGKFENGLQIEASYGNVALELDTSLQFGYDLFTDYGNISFEDGEVRSRRGKAEDEYYIEGDKMITVICDNGDIKISNIKE